MSGALMAQDNPAVCGQWLNMKKENHETVNFVDGLIYGYQIATRIGIGLAVDSRSQFAPYLIKKSTTVEDDLRAVCRKNPGCCLRRRRRCCR
jgi:hypothetical protein